MRVGTSVIDMILKVVHLDSPQLEETIWLEGQMQVATPIVLTPNWWGILLQSVHSSFTKVLSRKVVQPAMILPQNPSNRGII
jgi:hypothetical protein